MLSWNSKIQTRTSPDLQRLDPSAQQESSFLASLVGPKHKSRRYPKVLIKSMSICKLVFNRPTAQPQRHLLLPQQGESFGDLNFPKILDALLLVVVEFRIQTRTSPDLQRLDPNSQQDSSFVAKSHRYPKVLPSSTDIAPPRCSKAILPQQIGLPHILPLGKPFGDLNFPKILDALLQLFFHC